MRQKMKNEVIIAGRLYQHDLQLKTVKSETSANKGMEFISGTIEIATDDECTNIVPIHYTYIPRLTKKGTVDSRFTALQNIMSAKCVVADGPDAAMKLKVQSNLGLNDFYNNDDELVSAKRNESGFITVLSTLDGEERNKFTMDMVIAQATDVDENEERQIPAHVKLRGYVFDFRNAALPVEFMVTNEEGMKYFSNLLEDGPVFTKVWGIQDYKTIKTTQTSEAAFGEDEVTTHDRKKKDWIVTGTQKMTYEFDSESEDLTPEELKAKLADREVYLAEVKKRADEWKAQRDSGVAAANAAAASQTTVAAGGFKF